MRVWHRQWFERKRRNVILLVSDTSVLIDLDYGGLLPVAFAAGMPMVVPDLLYANELEPYNGTYYRALGLQVVSLQPDEVSFAQQVKNERKPLSLPDCFALACARRQDHALLTGDGPLRIAAKAYGVPMYGLLWLLDALADSGTAAHSVLHEGLTKISQGPRCRLPKGEIQKRLARWDAASL